MNANVKVTKAGLITFESGAAHLSGWHFEGTTNPNDPREIIIAVLEYLWLHQDDKETIEPIAPAIQFAAEAEAALWINLASGSK